MPILKHENRLLCRLHWYWCCMGLWFFKHNVKLKQTKVPLKCPGLLNHSHRPLFVGFLQLWQRWSIKPFEYRKHSPSANGFTWLWSRIFITSSGVTKINLKSYKIKLKISKNKTKNGSQQSTTRWTNDLLIKSNPIYVFCRKSYFWYGTFHLGEFKL